MLLEKGMRINPCHERLRRTIANPRIAIEKDLTFLKQNKYKCQFHTFSLTMLRLITTQPTLVKRVKPLVMNFRQTIRVQVQRV